jgi:hypothetical protein
MTFFKKRYSIKRGALVIGKLLDTILIKIKIARSDIKKASLNK